MGLEAWHVWFHVASFCIFSGGDDKDIWLGAASLFVQLLTAFVSWQGLASRDGGGGCPSFPTDTPCNREAGRAALRSVLQNLNDPFHRYDLTNRSVTHDERRDMKENIPRDMVGQSTYRVASKGFCVLGCNMV